MKDESEFEAGEIHGQSIFNYRHPHIHDGQEAELIVRAFQRDFEVNGPSVARIVRTTLAGWRRYKNHANPRIRARFAWESRELASAYSAAIWAMRQYCRRVPAVRAKMSRLLRDLHREFGWKSRFSAALGGPYLVWKTRQEEKRLRRGWTYEPPTFYERNRWVAPPLDKDLPCGDRCRFVAPRVAPDTTGVSLPSPAAKLLGSTGQAPSEPMLRT